MPSLREFIGEICRHITRVRLCTILSIWLVISSLALSQIPIDKIDGATVQGSVRDSQGHLIVDASVSLRSVSNANSRTAQTGPDGVYRFTAVEAGSYTLRTEVKGYIPAIAGPVNLIAAEAKQIDLTLTPAPSSATTAKTKLDSQSPEFFDEPQFTVAGVTQATTPGGHGSDTVLRSAEALARATVSLSKESNKESTVGSTQPITPAAESSLRDALVHNPKDAALHHALADVEERLGHPLEAVREYQHAAELDPSEINLFDWGTELLTHRALEPASEVFTQGTLRFPKSAQMLVALGVSWYARGDFDRAANYLETASDLAPDDTTPYLFLGRMERLPTFPTKGVAERLERFAQQQPTNVPANYYYAVSLWKQSVDVGDASAETFIRIESLLLKAVQLDTKFGPAYMELGILYSQRGQFSRAIPYYQKAVAVSPDSDEIAEEAHYRLSQAYQRTGDITNAKQELELRDALAKKKKVKVESDRRSIQEFVVSLQKQDPASRPQP